VGGFNRHIPDVWHGKQSVAQLGARARPFLAKVARQLAKDYAFFPALAPWNAPRVLAGNLLANTARNVRTFSIIFCGHFPAGVRFYREEERREPRAMVFAPGERVGQVGGDALPPSRRRPR
jgi:hypothetical protein